VTPSDPAKTVVMARMIWAFSFVCQFAFFVVVLVMMRGPSPGAGAGAGAVVERELSRGASSSLWWGPVAATVLGLPIALFARNQIYKRHWVGDVVSTQGYLQANLVFLAICEGLAFLAMVFMMIDAMVWPHIVPMLVVMGLFVVNFPTGAPMRPRSPDIPRARL
jgi:hypothetical protein